MPDIDYTEQDGAYIAHTQDGFCIRISAPSPPCVAPVQMRTISVWPDGHSASSLDARMCSLQSSKEVAAQMLSAYRAVAEMFREQGRAEVRAAQGQLAEAMHAALFEDSDYVP